jgi:hypothetical protein
MFDLAYLCGFFQTEMARAAERLLSGNKSQDGAQAARAAGAPVLEKRFPLRKRARATSGNLVESAGELDAVRGASAT